MDAPKENAGIPDDKANAAGTQPPDPIKEAELLRIRSEIARNEAETRKFDSEAKDFDGKHSKGKTDTIIKAVIGGMIGAGLLVAWFIAYMQPILEKNRKLGELEKQIHEAENLVTDQKLNEKTATLNILNRKYDKDQIAYKRDLQSVKSQYDSLKARQDQLILTYEKKIKNQGDQNSAETKHLKDELNKLKTDQQKTETKAVDLNDKIISNWLIENDWRVESKWEGGFPDNSKWRFNPNGKVEIMVPAPMVTTWKIKDGKLTVLIGEYATYTAKISKMQTPIEGTKSDVNGRSGTWKMTMENSKERDQIINDYCQLQKSYDFQMENTDPLYNDGKVTMASYHRAQKLEVKIDSMEKAYPWLKTIDCSKK